MARSRQRSIELKNEERLAIAGVLSVTTRECLCQDGTLSGQEDDVRTRFEPFVNDPEFLQIIANIKKIKFMVEELGTIAGPHVHMSTKREEERDENVSIATESL